MTDIRTARRPGPWGSQTAANSSYDQRKKLARINILRACDKHEPRNSTTNPHPTRRSPSVQRHCRTVPSQAAILAAATVISCHATNAGKGSCQPGASAGAAPQETAKLSQGPTRVPIDERERHPERSRR